MTACYYFIDDAKTFGGAQVALLNSILAIRKLGAADIKVMVARENQELISRLVASEIKAIELCPGALPVNLFMFVMNLHWFMRYFRDKKKFSNNIFIANLSGLEFCIAPSIAIGLYGYEIHGWLHNTARLSSLMPNVWFLRRIFYFMRDVIAERFAVGLYKSIFVPSKAAASLLKTRINNSRSVSPLYNVLNCAGTPFFCSWPSPRQYSIEQKLSIVIVGRIEFSTKGQDISASLVQAFNKIDIKTKIIIVGDGPDKKLLEKMFQNLGLSNSLKITGWQQDVTKFIDSADVVLIPSRHESFSLVATEAMSRYKPVVTSNLPCFEELLTEEFICQTNSIDEYVKKILRVIRFSNLELSQLYEPTLRKCSSEKFVENFVKLASVSE